MRQIPLHGGAQTVGYRYGCGKIQADGGSGVDQDHGSEFRDWEIDGFQRFRILTLRRVQGRRLRGRRWDTRGRSDDGKSREEDLPRGLGLEHGG